MLLNEDQIALRDVARRFSREKLNPITRRVRPKRVSTAR